MTNRKPYPILSALRREGDTATLQSLKLWWLDYHEGPPKVAANDNERDGPIDPEVIRREHDAEDLVAALDSDKTNSNDPKYTKQYSADAHLGTHKPDVRQAGKSAPPLPDNLDAEAEMARYIDAKRMREFLGADAETLDMAIGPHTYSDVGRHIGASGVDKTVERAGKQEVKDVAKIFWDEAA